MVYGGKTVTELRLGKAACGGWDDQAVREQITGMCADAATTRRLATAEAVEGHFRGQYYFAYGSNMAPAQMTARCPSAGNG